ncbi:MAG TPA: ATP-binding cassette domain-containing protein [Nocardioides sp.]|nr:ATP-binding cassette domain-containing protein [Nocardioides sp.]
MTNQPAGSPSGDMAVSARGLTKSFGETRALRGIDLDIPRGSVLGVLGPNGAGKTTAVRILTTLLRADSGDATVLGYDVRTQPHEVRKRIGLAGQAATVDEILSGRQNLELVGRLYHLDAASRRRRSSELLEQFDLTEAADRPAKEYSGGMRRRLDLAAALVADPQLLVLDEPTTGLDPRSRNDLWDVLTGLVDGGATLLLTTQYLEEADRLADRIAVIDHGSVIAEGTASQLKREVGGERVAVTASDAADVTRVAEIVATASGAAPQVDRDGRAVTAAVTGLDVLGRVSEGLHAAGIEVDFLGLHRPTLDDVFLQLTGHHAENGAPTTADATPEGADA